MRDLSRTRLQAVDPRLKTCPYATPDVLINAFEDDGEPDDLGIMQVLEGFVPLSRMMAEPIRTFRQLYKTHARPATSPVPESRIRKLVA